MKAGMQKIGMWTMGVVMAVGIGDLVGTNLGRKLSGNNGPYLTERVIYKAKEGVNYAKDRIQVAEERKEYNIDPSLSYEQARIKLNSIHFDEACRKYGIEKPAEDDNFGNIAAHLEIMKKQLDEIVEQTEKLSK